MVRNSVLKKEVIVFRQTYFAIQTYR